MKISTSDLLMVSETGYLCILRHQKDLWEDESIYPLNIGILYLVISDQRGTVFEFIF